MVSEQRLRQFCNCNNPSAKTQPTADYWLWRAIDAGFGGFNHDDFAGSARCSPANRFYKALAGDNENLWTKRRLAAGGGLGNDRPLTCAA